MKTFRGAMSLARGQWYRAWSRITGKRFRAGRNFRIYGRLDIRGPGEVVFGDNVSIIEHARFHTHAPDALLTLGDDVLVGTTRFGCARRIQVGNLCQFAEAYIMDTDFHSIHVDRRTNPEAPIRVAPVYIGDNVWVGHFAGVLPGARIGRNSVVSFGSVCARDYPDDSLLVGNPARVAGKVPGGAGLNTLSVSSSAGD
jgi:acetyltransferase-like isoleucine patch superfamily enzyme